MAAGNFGFLQGHSPLLAELGAAAERLYPFDPASCVLKLRLLAESLTQDIAARLGIQPQQLTQSERFMAVDHCLGLDPQVRNMFHLLRQRRNVAAHEAGRGARGDYRPSSRAKTKDQRRGGLRRSTTTGGPTGREIQARPAQERGQQEIRE